MFTKKNILLSLLYIFSITLGFTLGKVNLFELISGAVKLNLLLFILAVVLVFFTSICLFLLEMTKEDKIYTIYSLSSLAFGLSFFIASLNVISSLLTPLVYFWFLQFTYSQSSARALMLTKFLPGEIFMPVLRQSFTYLLIFFTLISFIQTRDRISENTLINDTLIDFVARPVVPMVNKEISKQLIDKLGVQYTGLPLLQKKQVVTTTMNEIVKSFTDEKTGVVFGIPQAQYPVDVIEVTDDGAIDIGPMITEMHPQIKQQLEMLLSTYGYLVPAIVALLVFLFIQPVFFVFKYIESAITMLLFWFLIRVGFMKISIIQTQVERVSI